MEATDKTVGSAQTTPAKSKVLYFSASWCQPCQVFGPLVDKVRVDFPHIEVEKLDIDKEEGQLLGFKHGVMSIPMLVAENSRPIIGTVSEATLRKWFEHIGG